MPDMILGIGTDICDIGRIEKSLAKHGDKFEHKIFTKSERDYCAGKAAKAECYAKRFAAKEALAKALSTEDTGWLTWQDVEIKSAPSGKPSITLHGKALERLIEMTPDDHIPTIHLSLSDEPPYALAFVIISLAPHAA